MKYLVLVLAFSSSLAGYGQQKTAKPATTAMPKLSARWGNMAAGNLTVAQVQQLVDSPLVALDEKGNRYPVIGFRINYTFKGSYKDEETGQTRVVKDFRAYDFDKTDRLTDLWKESVRDNAKKEDDILFNNIRVRLRNGKSAYAPELRFAVK